LGAKRGKPKTYLDMSSGRYQSDSAEGSIDKVRMSIRVGVLDRVHIGATW